MVVTLFSFIFIFSLLSQSQQKTANYNNDTINECPPGFYHPSNKTNKTCNCECTMSTSRELYGITKCNHHKCTAFLSPRFWAGYVNFKGRKMLMTSNCPKDYCSNTGVELPNSSHTAIDNLVCSHYRTGYVCGKCQSGYYVYMNSPLYHCGSCNDTHSDNGYFYTLAFKYLPLTLMMCFITFFDISLVDGPLNSFILCGQMISCVHRIGKISITYPTEGANIARPMMRIAIFLYNIWNLIFIEPFLPNYCAYKSDGAMPIIASEYIAAFYVLFLCIVFFTIIPWICKCCSRSNHQLQKCTLKIERMCIRVRYRWSVKNSIIHSLTTFIVLSYAKITLVTFQLLTPVFMYGPGGLDSYYRKSVVWYDGSMSYFGHEHFPYAITALIMFIVFVLIPPLLLLSYPLLPVLLTQLGVQDYWIVNKIIINPMSKCVPIFDAFQSCYKDEYRFFAGLLFVYRVLASGVSAFTPTIALNLAWLQGLLLLILLLHCICQPYKKKWHNCIEGIIFTELAFLNTISSYRLFQEHTANTSTNVSFWVQVVLLYCPIIYFILYTGVKVSLWLNPRIIQAKNALLKLCGNDIDNTDPLEAANLFNSREFPARVESDGYSTTMRSTREPVALDDKEQHRYYQQRQQQQQQQQRQEQQQDNEDNDVEMIHPVANHRMLHPRAHAHKN